MKSKKSIKLNKRLSITLVFCMLFQILQGNFSITQKVSAATGLRHQTVGNDVMLGGNYIEVGVSKAGSFGTNSAAPSGFHPSYDGMNQEYNGVGLRVDGDGFDTGNPPTTGDFFLPGTPEESFTVGYKVGASNAAPTKYTNAERVGIAGIATVTTDSSTSDTLAALTSGNTSDNNLSIQQKISFKVNDKFFKNTVTYTNRGTNTLYDLRYMRSFDPDQDAVLHGSYETYNSVLENFPQDKRAIVRATGAVTRESVFFISLDDRARASTFGFDNRDPYDAQAYNSDGSQLKTPKSLVDQAIAMTFSLGNLAPGQSTTFEYYTCLDPNYNSGLEAIMGSLGLQINNGAATTNSLDVTLNLSGSNVAQMRFSNDNSTWSSWETYASTKAWTLTPGDGVKTVYAQLKDSTGNISNVNASITYKDSTAPTISVSGNPTTWTNANVTLTVSASDTGSGLNTSGAYSFDGGSTWTTENSKSFSTNGTVNIKVRDNSGNISSQSIVVNKIDKAAPTFSGITNTPSAWTNSGVTLTVSGATDNGGAGLNSLPYSFSTIQGIYNWQASNVSSSFSENQPVYVYVRDDLGNISSASTVNINAIDKVLPTITNVTGNSSDWTSGDVTLTVNASDALSGLAAAAYSFDGGNTWQTGNTKTYTENTSNIIVKVKDAAGNIAAYSPIDITKIDKTAPTITSVIGNPSDWTSNDVTLTVNASDALSGLAAAGYSFDGGNTWQAGNVKTYTENKSNIVVKVKDVAGNITTYSPVNITKIDKTVPNTAVIANSDKYTESSWYKDNQIINASFTTTAGSSEKLQYKVNDGAWTDGASVPVSTEGKYDVSYRVIDSLGRTSAVQTVKVNIDKTAPTNAKITVKDREFTSILNTITFGIFFKDTVNVSITADGNISGVKKIEYQKVAKNTDYNPSGTWTSGSSFNVDPDDKFVVYARITDNAGNAVVINSDGVVVDATKPALAVTPSVSNWTNSNVGVKVNVSDALAGVKDVTYTTNETTPQAGTVAISSGEGNITLSNEGQYVLTVTAKDNSDNEVIQTANIKLDKTAPTIASVTGNPSDWTSSDVTLTVNASDTISGLATEAYSFDGGSTWQARNTKTYTDNTSNIIVKVKDAVGNITAFSPVNITKIDKTVPNTAVIANSDKYTENNWYNGAQTISAGFTATTGCAEKLQYKINNGAWTDGASITVGDEGKHDVSFRVIDSLNRTSAVQTVKVNVDKTAPTNAKITIKDKEFTSLLNKITFGIFFKDTVNVSITADANISGIKKVEYQKVEKDTDYNVNGTWTSGNSFDVTPDDKFVVYAKITDNAGNYVIINSDGVIVDSTNPVLAVTSDANDWTSKDVNIKVEASDKLSGVNEVTYTTDEKVPQTGTITLTDGVGTIKLSNEGYYKLTVTAKDNSLNEVSQVVDVNIDRTAPVMTGAAMDSSYFVGRVIKLSDNIGEVASATYKVNAGDETSFSNDALFEKAGKYTLTLKDKAGNSSNLSFEIKALPKVEDVIYTPNSKELIENIRAEFNGHNDLPEPYKTNADNGIKALEARYAKLDKEVKDIKAETSVIKGKVDALPKEIDGLISLNKEIQNEYNKIAGNTSTLTVEQKLALQEEAEYLKQQLAIITGLQNQIDEVDTRVSSIDTKVDGLISKEGTIKEILNDVDKLTKEQQHILQPQIDILNGLVGKINVLKEEVETVKGMISKLPSAAKVTKNNADLLKSVDNAYNKLTNEQKSLVGDYYVKWLNDCLDALSKLMLHNDENDLTVTGIDGTSFDSDVYLVVTPIKNDSTSTEAKFASSAESVKKAAATVSEIKGKELVALYDVSLFKDNVKVQPDGKVRVKVKVPEEYKGREGLDIVHIADDGTVTPMHAVVEDGYLAFITTHFSEYAIVAVPVAKAATTTIPKTGSPIDLNSLVALGVLLILTGTVVVRRQRRRRA
jgi:LPXTG-motif cell wall-anchored protein